MSNQTTESDPAGGKQQPVPAAVRRCSRQAPERFRKTLTIVREWVLKRRRRVAAAIVLLLMAFVWLEPESGESGFSSALEISWSGDTKAVDPDDSFFEDYFEQLPEFPDKPGVAQSQPGRSENPANAKSTTSIQSPEVPAIEPLDMSVGIVPAVPSVGAVSSAVYPASNDASQFNSTSQPSELLMNPESNPDGIRPVKFRGNIVPLTK